jgi:undecaprenyl-diphosphatase
MSSARVKAAPSDVLRLVVAVSLLLITVVIGALFDDAIVGFVSDLLRGLDALPSWLMSAVVVIGQVLGVVLLGGGLVVTIARRRWFLLGMVVAASALAALLTWLLHPLLDATASRAVELSSSIPLDPDDLPTAIGVAVIAAIVTAVSPWVSRDVRRAGWTLVVLTATTRFLGAPVSFDTLVGVLAGWVAGSAVIVVFGAPSRRPDRDAIAGGLAAVGVDLERLEPASVDARGSTPYFGATTDGTALFVKALGEDERSADLLFRMYRRLQPRDLGDEKRFSTLRRAVEHEALVALAARGLGVRTPRLVALATAEPNGLVLAYETIDGRSLDRVAPEELDDGTLRAVWDQLALMRTHRVAHRDLRLANVFLADDGSAWIIDFGFSELAASDLLLATDLAELTASSSTQVGVERAVRVGASVVGPEVLTTALPRLHLPMLSGATRSALKASPGKLDELRDAIAALEPTPL